MTFTVSETTVLRLSVWLNAWQSGHITAFDAANACEAITTSLDVLIDDERHPWIDLLAYAGPLATPFRVALPVPGNPDGVPRDVIGRFDESLGLIVMDDKMVIGTSSANNWTALRSELPAIQYDVQHARISLLATIQEAGQTLQHLDLVGSRITADKALQDLSFGHVPPSTPRRTVEALELGYRISTLARIARDDSTAIASRSQDHERSRILLEIEQRAQTLLKAAASSSHA